MEKIGDVYETSLTAGLSFSLMWVSIKTGRIVKEVILWTAEKNVMNIG